MEFFFADSAGFFVGAGSFDLYTLNETFDPEGEKGRPGGEKPEKGDRSIKGQAALKVRIVSVTRDSDLQSQELIGVQD